MWVKILHNGAIIAEDVGAGRTWLTTSDNIYACYLVVNDQRSPVLRGCKKYWHSRTARVATNGSHRVVAEHLQGLLENGKWLTITWNGKNFEQNILDHPIGKPLPSRTQSSYS